jgi:hypothetical protein
MRERALDDIRRVAVVDVRGEMGGANAALRGFRSFPFGVERLRTNARWKDAPSNECKRALSS